MPLLHISVNQIVATDKKQTVMKEASALTSTLLGKPEAYVMIKLDDDADILFAGTDKPAAHLLFKSLGLPEDKTAQFSEALCQFINQQFDIDVGRVYIEFTNGERHLWGWNNKTFG